MSLTNLKWILIYLILFKPIHTYMLVVTYVHNMFFLFKIVESNES